jgi:MtaA/CmuA family methyltransferase
VSSAERVRRRMAGEPVDRPPNWDIMMTFAAHFIGAPLSHYYQDFRVLCDANMAVLEAFDLDIVQAISDPYRETADLGAEIEFPEDGLPICRTPLLRDPALLQSLRPVPPHAGRRMSDRLEAVRRLRELVGPQVPVMGWVEGALAEAADLRGVGSLLLDLYDRPEWVRDLLELCTEVEIAFARAQVEAGAEIIGLGDAIASQVSPAQYREFALPYEQRIIAAVHAQGARVRLHVCGNITHLLPFVAQSGADVIDLDWMVDLGEAARVFAGRSAPCGNFDPVAIMLRGTPDQVRHSVTECLRLGGERSFSAAGCEIPDGTPHANLRAQAEALREYVEPEA